MPFEDLFEQATVFDLLDELAKQPNQQAITDFSNPNYILVRRLILLMAQIQETEKKHGVKLGGSYQFAIVRNLLWALEDCTNAGKLKKSLPEIREALLRAMVIQVQVDYDVLEPFVARGKAFSNHEPKGLDALSRTLLEILKRLGKKAKNRSILKDLKSMAANAHAVIQEVGDESVWWKSSKGEKETSVRQVEKRLTDLRKKI